jgi:hypothetical protein
MTVVDILQSLFALLICGGAFSQAVARWPEAERRVAMYCWCAHAVGAFAIIAVYEFYYGWGDMLHYFAHGRFLARYVEYDPVNHFPQLLDLLLQRDGALLWDVDGAGTSTGSMVAVGGLVGLITTSSWAGSVVLSSLAAAGQACLWRGVRSAVPAERETQALWSFMLVPSVVFWSSTLLKETIALIGIGVAVLGLARIRERRFHSGGMLTILGVYIIGLFKAYILFPLAFAIGVYLYWTRAALRNGVRVRPIALVAGAGFVIVLLSVLGEVFPRYSVENVSESIEQQQRTSTTTSGGSDYRQATPDQGPRGTAGLIADAPLTIVTSLFRPFIFESRSAMMLVNSVEMTAILYFVVMAFVRTGRVELLRWAWRSPDILASLAFVLSFSLAVGLATTNLGTLSRYRLPMMPFYIYVVAAAHALPARRDARRRAAAERVRSRGETLVEGV